MSEDQKRDPEGARLTPDDDARPEAEADADIVPDPDEDKRRRTDYVKMPPPVDEDAIAKHRAAKEARIRKRMEEKRQAGAEGPTDPREHGPKAPRVGKFSALPALRPDLKADTPALRAERVEAIRRDLVRRRRRKGGSILFKLWLFVMLPTTLVAWFLWFHASDLYKSESLFKVESADSGSSGGSGSGLLGAFLGGGSAIFDPNAVHAFILSRDVLRKLDKDHAWIAHFQSPELDVLHRIPDDAGFEEAYDHYGKMVEVSFDPTEGIIEMSMVAADPETARRFSDAVIGYSETMINDLSERIRADSEADAARNLVEAEDRLRQAQEALAQLQKAQKTFTVEGEVAAEMAIISGMEVELEALRGRMTNLLRVTSSTDPRVQRIGNQIETLTSQIATRRDNITGERGQEDASLADINLALTKARFEVEAATAIFAAAVERNEVAVANSRRQHRYLAVISHPSVPDEANYPKKPQMTALAFLGFLGFYIVGSLTISLIREQASI